MANPPRKSRLITGILFVLFSVSVLTPLAICWIFFLGKVYGTLVFASNLALVTFATWFSRKNRMSEAEQLRRIDKVMGKPSDDPRRMANFVP
jgi:hypothetical protein